jgi:hypothetical protein
LQLLPNDLFFIRLRVVEIGHDSMGQMPYFWLPKQSLTTS